MIKPCCHKDVFRLFTIIQKKFDFKEGQTVTFWAYGLGRVEAKGWFVEEMGLIGFKAK